MNKVLKMLPEDPGNEVAPRFANTVNQGILIIIIIIIIIGFI